MKIYKTLNFFYKTTLGHLLLPLITKKLISKLSGFYNNLYISRFNIKGFIKRHNLNPDNFLKPVSEFKTFNEFFIRELKPGVRLIDPNENGIVSPADSNIFVIEDICNTDTFFIKSEKFNLSTFLQSTALASKYKNGTMLIFRLAPEDYHRFHFPLACTPKPPRVINGIYHSVNPVVYGAGYQPLLTNERHVVELTESCLMVTVGALCVGRVVETYTPNRYYKRGEEAGYFAYGGSTVVLLFKKDTISVKSALLTNKEEKVKMGELIATRNEHEKITTTPNYRDNT